MARPRTFDESAVLEAAAAQFRVHGFADTSTEQLCAAAGVKRSSLYNTFISKDELFVRALEHYIETSSTAQATVVDNAELNGMERLQGILDLIIEEEVTAAAEGHAAGCMVVASRMTPDLETRDERIKSLLDRSLERQLSMLTQVITAGQRDGSIRENVHAQAAALLIVTNISGIRVAAQAGSQPDELRQVAILSLDTLRP